MKHLTMFLSLALLFHGWILAQEQEKEELQFLMIEAMNNNPEIAAEVYKMKIAEERVPQAGALDDPEFTYKLMEFPGTRFNQALYENFELMQMIMFPTKLSTRKDIAQVRAEHAHHEHLEKVVEIIAQLKSAYAMLWNARASLKINLENQRLLNQILQAAQTQYAVGKVSQQDVLKTNIELAKQKTQEAVLRQEIVSAESMLRAILNRPTDSAVGEVEYDKLVPVQYPLNDLLQFALTNRPMVIHDSLGVREGELMVSMSKQEYLPDFKVSLERVTMPTMGLNTWSVEAGITIPFAPWTLSKASARVQEAEAEHLMKQSMFKSTKNMVGAQIRDAYAKAKALETQVRSFDEIIIPQTSQSLQSLLAEYQTGKTSFLMLIDSYRMYQEIRMEATMGRMKYEQAVASLERQVGVVNLNIIPLSVKEN